MKQLSILLTNTGPHERLELHFKPGVSILRGRNGAGKSQFIQAAATALGGDGSVSVLDGKLKGTVSVDGVLVLQIGKTVNRKGQPSVEIGTFSAISDMIEPGIADPKKADARRVKAILSMAPVPLDETVIQTLTSGDARLTERPPPVDAPNILAVAEHFRQTANELALEAERRAGVAKARSDADSASLAEMPVADSRLPFEEAEKAVALADRKLSQVSLLATQREEMVERQRRIRETLGEMPAVRRFQYAIKAAETRVESARKELGDAEMAVAIAKKEVEAASTELLTARKENATACEALDKWDKQARILQEPITGPTADDVVAAQRALESAQKEASAARIKANRDTLQEQIGKLMVEADAASEQCKELRTLAHDVATRLGEILAKHGLDGFDVEDGRLYAKVDGKRQLFKERLSFGQQAKLALSLACKSFKSRLIPMQPEFWASLQPSAQSELTKLAVEMGCYLVTESPSDEETISVESLS